ncbi:hypothetical protein CMO91_00360 [Candidatus Woesearchaeota archaeon]|nr:hypothetical protein [Candidatus Woesearchaeota archaeon]
MRRGMLVSIVMLALIVIVTQYTGFLHTDTIDDKDRAYWTFDNDVIIGAEGYTLAGTEECWVLAHGYTSTPPELASVAHALHDRFNDTIYVPRINGHGQLPSRLETYTVEGWYSQIEELATRHGCRNLLGSSMGSVLVLRYAIEHDVDRVVIASPPFRLEPPWLPQRTSAVMTTAIARYLKKSSPGANIKDPEGSKAHIAPWSFPTKNVVELIDFKNELIPLLSQTNGDVLVIQSLHDRVVSAKAAREAFANFPEPKTLVELDRGNHLVFMDYDKEEAIQAVLNLRG